MAANEIEECIAAHAWLRLGPQVGDVNALDNASVGFRSQVSFVGRVVTTADAEAYPLVILELDRELTRSQNQVLAYLCGTVDAIGRSYPQPELGDSPRLANVEAIHTSWIGDYADPSWLPFTADPVPDAAARNLDKFNAVALLLPAQSQEVGVLAYAGDVCVLVLQSPIGGPYPAALPVIPNPGPPTPVPQLYRYYAPGTASAEGAVLLWPDTGSGTPGPLVPLDSFAVPPSTAHPQSFDHSLILNDLQVIANVGDEPVSLYGEGLELHASAFSFVMVGAVENGHRRGYLYQVGGAVEAFVVGYDADSEDYWFVQTNAGRVSLGNASIIAIAITAHMDGTWDAAFFRDWSLTETASGTWDQTDPLYYSQMFGYVVSGDVGNIQVGEADLYSLTEWNFAAQFAQISALRPVWSGPKTWLFDSESVTSGLGNPVTLWPDTGTQPLINATQLTLGTPTLTAGYPVMNDFPVVVADANNEYLGSGTWYRVAGRGFTMAAMVRVPSNGVANSISAAVEIEGDEFYGVEFVVSRAVLGDPSFTGWVFEAANVLYPIVAVSGEHVFAFAMTCADDGAWRVVYSIDWEDNVVVTGTADALPADYGYSFAVLDVTTGQTFELANALISNIDAGVPETDAVLEGYRIKYQPPVLQVFDGPSLTAGLVSTWPNTGNMPQTPLTPSMTTLGPFTAAVGLDGNITAGVATLDYPRGMEGAFRATSGLTVAAVLRYQDNGYCSVEAYNVDGESISLVLDGLSNPATDHQLQFWFGLTLVVNLAILNPGDVAYMVGSMAVTGDWNCSYAVNDGAISTDSGTEPALTSAFTQPFLAMGRASGSTITPEIATCSMRAGVLDFTAQATLLEAMRTAWPPPLFP